MDGERARLAFVARVVGGLLAIGAGAGALAIAHRGGRFTTYAGISSAGSALMLIAGLGLATAGLVVAIDRRAGLLADLALCAGLMWFAPVWIAWQDGPPLVRSVAVVLSGFTFPVLLHLVLGYPTGGITSLSIRTFVWLVYVEATLAAGVLALSRDPYFDPGCWANCTVNSFLVRSHPVLAHDVTIADRWFTATAAGLMVAICVMRLITASSPARVRLVPIAVPAVVFAGALAAHGIRLHSTVIEDPTDTALFAIYVITSGAVIVLAAGLVWSVLRARAEGRAVVRIVADLDDAPPAGFLQSALGAALHDPHLRIAYWLPDTQRFVDANGRNVPEPAGSAGRTITRLTRNGRAIAAISHAIASDQLENQLGPAIRLGLENERLQAEVLAQIEELRRSRARIVETADLERRGLERDLHDGAQQSLLALSYDIRLARASAKSDADSPTELMLARAVEETQSALEELRELAHGIYPAILTEAGVLPALATLADTAPLHIRIVRTDDRRYPAPIEAAAYFAVAEAVDDAAHRTARHATLTVAHEDGRLIVTVDDDGSSRISPMLALADRVGALGGTVLVEPTTCRVEIPCAPS